MGDAVDGNGGEGAKNSKIQMEPFFMQNIATTASNSQTTAALAITLGHCKTEHTREALELGVVAIYVCSKSVPETLAHTHRQTLLIFGSFAETG